MSLLSVTFIVLKLILRLSVVRIIHRDVCGPMVLMMMTMVMVVMVVVMVPVGCGPVVVDLGLIRVALIQGRAPAPGVRVRGVFSGVQLHVGGLLVAHVVLVFIMMFSSIGAGAMVMMVVVVMAMTVFLWLTMKKPLLFLCFFFFLHFLVLLFFLFRLLGLRLRSLLRFLRSFSLSCSRFLALLFFLYRGRPRKNVIFQKV